MFLPFKDRQVHELAGKDLATLADIPEGWFIEYKREPCSPRDYAKEASAFANCRGGWLFVGIAQDPSTQKPSGGPGVPTLEVGALLNSIRDSLTQNLSPVPQFELGSITGPIPELGVDSSSSVLVVRVPESQYTPHVHCSGKIYSRQGDKAAPVAITTRLELDDLYARATRRREYIDKVLDRGFEPAWSEQYKSPWIYCAMTPSVSNRSTRKVPTFEEWSSIFLNENTEGLSLPNIYSSALGYIASNHSLQENRSGPASILEYTFDGSIYITLPLSTSDNCGDAPFLKDSLGQRFLKVLKETGRDDIQVFDGTYTLTALLGAHWKVLPVLKMANVTDPYLIRIQGLNFFRRIPFFSSATYIDWCERSGVPLISRNNFRIPWREWLKIEDIYEKHAVGVPAGHLLPAFGVPITLATVVIQELFKVAIRPLP